MSFLQAQHVFISGHHFLPHSCTYGDLDLQEPYPNSAVRHKTAVARLFDYFCDSGNVTDKKYSRRPCVLTNGKADDVRQWLLQSPTNYSRNFLCRHVYHTKVHRGLQNIKPLCPCGAHMLQEVKQLDKAKCIHYCHWFHFT
jgi:hypothetical protein